MIRLFVLLLAGALLPISIWGQCPSGTIASANNLVVNGDFEQGNTGFTSQYTYCNTANCLQPEATYAVGPDASFFHTAFVGFDHTTGSGNFMIVNGSSQPNTNVWCQTITVNPNTTYEFSTWVQTCVASSPAILQFEINGNLIGSSFTAPSVTNQWVQFYATWNSGANTTATICIINQNTATGGNDFGLDDIVFTECIPCQINSVTAVGDTTVCPGVSVPLSATADTPSTYTWSPSATLSDPDSAFTTAQTNTTTTYTVTAQDSVGCTRQDSVTVTISNGPPYTLPDRDTLCLGDTMLMPLQASGSLQFTWQPNTDLSCTSCPQPAAYPTVSRWYTVTLANTNCSITDSIFIQVVDTPRVDAGPDRVICNLPFTQLQGTYNSTVPMQSILWSPPTGLSHTFLLNPIANPTQSTTYTLTITNIYGCVGADSVDVIRTVVTADAGPDTSICPGSSVVLGTSATSKTQYQWQPATSLSSDTVAQPLASPQQTTLYTLTITDSNGCQATDYVKVTVWPNPNFTPSLANPICEGDTASLSITGGQYYQWLPSASLSCDTCATTLAFPTQSSIYTVTGTDANGCADTATLSLTVHPPPTIQATGSSPICAGDTTTLQASGANSYMWSPGNSLSCTVCPNPSASPIGTTTYTVAGTDVNGCTDSTTVVIQTQNGPPIQVSSDTTICPGGGAPLSVQGGTTYQWTPGNSLSCQSCTNPVATPSQSTTYTVTAFNPIGCNSVDTVRVAVAGLGASSIAGDTAICPGDTAQWQVNGLTQWQWQPNQAISCMQCPDPLLYPNQSTTYTLQGTDSNGCILPPIDKTLWVTPPPQLNVVAPDTVCTGSLISLQVSGAAAYQWTAGQGLSCNTCPNPTVLVQNDQLFAVTGTSTGGCQSDTSFRVVAQPAPALSVGTTPGICLGDTAQLSANTAVSLQWTPGALLDCDTCLQPKAWPVQDQWFVATATNARGCISMDSMWVEVWPTPVVLAAPDTQVCQGEPVTLSASGAVTYDWSPAQGLSCTACPSPVASPTQSQWWWVTGTDANGCRGRDSVWVALASLPGLQVPGDTLICTGDTVALTVSGAASYQWSPPTGLSSTTGTSVLASPTDTVTYTLRATDANGCAQDTSFTIWSHQPLPPHAGPDTAICPGSSVKLFVTNGTRFNWRPSTGLSDTASRRPLASPTATTLYTVIKWDAEGCPSTETVRVALHPPAIAEAGPNHTIPEGGTVTLQGAGGGQYLWSPAQFLDNEAIANPLAAPLDSMWFVLQVVTEHGCTDQDSTFVAVIPNIHIHFPTGFSPNGDGINDYFGIGHGEGIQEGTLELFNRWGQRIFISEDWRATWDGRIDQAPAPQGVYIWRFTALLFDGRLVKRQGNVTLLR